MLLGMMLGREGIRRKIELHVALFLVLLSPGYNPPRRRWCLYLSRGKPPSVYAYLSRPPSRPGLPTPAPRSPRSIALSIHLLAAHSRPPHPLTTPARSCSLSPFPPRSSSLASLYHRSPRHTLFSLPVLSPPVRSHPPKTPLTPTLPIPPFSLLYTHALPFPPPTIPFTAASIRRSDSTQRQPPAEGGCALLAPESSRPRPHRGRGDGTGRAEGRAGG